MKYCMNCGKQLPDDAKFCVSCGTPVMDEPPKKRVEQAGTIYKCPNCGEVLESMTAICPACGYELRNVKAVNSVQAFADQLAKIEAEEMPEIENNSFMKKVFGRDFREAPKRLEEARHEFNRQKLSRKVNLITNFPVPNTKEDLTEFSLLIAANVQDTTNLALHDAWVGKLDQVYRKAKIMMPNDPAFRRISDLYSDIKRKAKTKKAMPFYILIGAMLLLMLMYGFETNAVLTYILTVIVVALIIAGIILKKRKERN